MPTFDLCDHLEMIGVKQRGALCAIKTSVCIIVNYFLKMYNR